MSPEGLQETCKPLQVSDHRPGAVFDEGTDHVEWCCTCGWVGSDFGEHVAALILAAKAEACGERDKR